MTTSWLLTALSLFFMASGVLLILLYLVRARRFAEAWLTPEGRAAYATHVRLLTVAVALLGAWFVTQYLGVIL